MANVDPPALEAVTAEWPEAPVPIAPAPSAAETVGPWHALWTRSHCERRVHDQLLVKGFRPFLPTISSWSKRAGQQHRIPMPMFAGYLFLHGELDRYRYIEVRKSRGLVGILGQGWERPATIPAEQMSAIERLQQADLDVVPHPYLREGRRVRVTRGPLAGLEGILVQLKSAKGRLVVSVDLLQRSVAAEIDCSAVVGA